MLHSPAFAVRRQFQPALFRTVGPGLRRCGRTAIVSEPCFFRPFPLPPVDGLSAPLLRLSPPLLAVCQVSAQELRVEIHSKSGFHRNFELALFYFGWIRSRHIFHLPCRPPQRAFGTVEILDRRAKMRRGV